MNNTRKRSKALFEGVLTLVFTLILVSQAAAQCVSPPPGLVSWWDADAMSGVSVFDIQDGNDGTLVNGATTALGQVGNAFSFDGVDDYVDIPDSAGLDSITSAVTVDMWIKPEVPAQLMGAIFSRRDPLKSEGFSIFLFQDGTLLVITRTTTSPSVSGSVFLSPSDVIQFGTFQHVAATADTSTGMVKIYLNGQELPLTTVFGPETLSGQLFTTNNLFIGRRQTSATREGAFGAAYYKGLIDEVEIYDRALSESEIQDIFDAGSAGKCKDPTVTINIKPGSDSNFVNCYNDNTVIAVNILTTDHFDALSVNHTTVTFEGASETHVDRRSGQARRHEEDVDDDGDTDLVLHFRLGDTGLTCYSTQGTLVGKTFVDATPIEGSDSVKMVQKGPKVITVGRPLRFVD